MYVAAVQGSLTYTPHGSSARKSYTEGTPGSSSQAVRLPFDMAGAGVSRHVVSSLHNMDPSPSRPETEVNEDEAYLASGHHKSTS
jgi:hypothetical protein